MKRAHLSFAGLVCVLAIPCLAGPTAKVIAIADEGAAAPGRVSIAEYLGEVPDSPARPVIDQMPGFPVVMGSHPNFKPTRGLVFADLDGNGDLEIIASSTDSKIYAWDYQGNLMTGFPVSTIGWCQYAPSVGDLDGDGDLEVVQPTRGQTSGGRLYALDHLGNVLPGFPKSFSNNNVSSCTTLSDLDGDGDLEIIASERAYPIGYIHIVEHDGSEWGGNWPVPIDHVPAATAAVGDLDDDGENEIVFLSYDSIYALEIDGKDVIGWPKQIANANFSYQSPALADLDSDGDLEIVVGAHRDAAGCYVFHHDGSGYPGWPKLVGTWTFCAPTVTDLEGDGVLEILDGRAGGFGGYSNCFWAWTHSGSVKPGFPYGASLGGGSEGPLTVADIDGDGVLEIFADYNISQDGSGFLFGVDATGNDLPGFPLRPKGFTYMNGAMIGDVDLDGDYELGVVSNHDNGADVNLYDLPDLYAPTSRDWKDYHASIRRGGLYPSVDVGCVGDLDGDGDTTQSDLGLLLASYEVDDGGDINGDGDTDQSDLGLLLADYGCTS